MDASSKYPTLRLILAVVAGFVIGSSVNMALVSISAGVIAPPAGASGATMEGLRAAMPLFEPKHFVFPFLAHALGTLVGAAFAAWLAPRRKLACAMAVGALFFLGGVAAAAMLPAPLWFEALDLAAAYFPMAWLGWKLAAGTSGALRRP